ncbi:MAG TPA: methylated-DNA--[protein]-cysteine S-methyltransferase [Paenibacillus sp.]|uniref:methylated-DNA--[protein]-cysteine S-methyltransferase n=1 Tax=Paenibacillus sp. TaxID=58172 RepID=UPI0028D299B3|nr:methylated-DNA--[protein]-cysteine S-methyltransferase [Paenibacillus sp.]HUC92304.1 methylated-DNA--[protein]-cysteine S-methyltransferase [Paenibacillus sp.]
MMTTTTTALTLYRAELESPIGPLVLCATDRGLCHIDFGTFRDREMPLSIWAAKQGLAGHEGAIEWIEAPAHPVLAESAAQLNAYFRGATLDFDLPLDMLGTAFQRSVWQELRLIPYGEVRSYKQVAAGIGKPLAVRAVGGANNRNPVPIVVPCHRVIGADGSMVGYGGGMPIKTFLLELEGYRQS